MQFLESASIARRRFLVMVGAVAAGLGTSYLLPGQVEAKANTNTKTLYVLDPEWGAGEPACPIPHLGGSGCHACASCHAHAANKMWTSAALADSSRAHTRCKCLVQSSRVSHRQYVAIFGPPKGPLHRDEFDRRQDELFLPEAKGHHGGDGKDEFDRRRDGPFTRH